MSIEKSFETMIKPRFCETDALTHISNTVIPIWFEEARNPVCNAIHPSMTIEDWPMIVARISIDYIAQVFVHSPVKIITDVSKVGNKSFTLSQKAYQQNKLVCSGECVIVYFDFKNQKTVPIPDVPRKVLEERIIHLPDTE